MDVHDGTTFGMANGRDDAHRPYSGRNDDPRAPRRHSIVTVETTGMSGPWVPILGAPRRSPSRVPHASAQKGGPFVDTWPNAALTTGPAGDR